MPNLLAAAVLALTLPPGPQGEDPVEAILTAFDSAWVVALGENHGHREFHDLVIRILEDPRAPGRIDDVAVEWGNALYQDLADRFVSGQQVPWDSVTMIWRNTVVSPNTVWDSPVYEQFFRDVRRLNATLPEDTRYRVLLTDSPVDWNQVDSPDQLRPYFDRARFMADVVRREVLSEGRRALFLAGGLHVSHQPRVRLDQMGVPVGEVTPVAWIEIHHPGSTFVVQSLGRADRLGIEQLVGDGPPTLVRLDPDSGRGAIPANRTTTLRNRDGSRPDVYGQATLGQIIDAVILWDPADLTFPETDPATYQVDWYWEALNRRSQLLRGQPMDPSLRTGASGG